MYCISKTDQDLKGEIVLPFSKSESNRLLIIKALCKEPFLIKNLSDANDTKLLNNILSSNKQASIDVEDAGTCMRFLTAYFALKTNEEVVLHGTERMHQRPIQPLVEALIQLGASIEYLDQVGFPPLKIKKKELTGNSIEIDGTISSQFISALLLIAPVLTNGLTIKINGDLVSKPYVTMTLKMMKLFGVKNQWKNNEITILHQAYSTNLLPIDENKEPYYSIESDWSAASYWYAMAALCKGNVDLTLKELKYTSFQGDVLVSALFSFFGIKTQFIANGVRLSKSNVREQYIGFNFSDNPDLAQTATVVAAALGIPCFFNGLQSLTIKETDRLQALKNELMKLGASIEIVDNDSIQIDSRFLKQTKEIPIIKTYNDHRMAMAFSPLSLHLGKIIIDTPLVVKKSYPNFWKDLEKMRFLIESV